MNNELVIIGAGPAGLAAAKEAASYGVKVLIIDENDKPGGQLFTQTHKFFGSKDHMAGTRGFQIGYDLLNNVYELDVQVLLNTVVWGIFDNNIVAFIKDDNKSEYVVAKNVLIATGALEKPIIFPGWTLPGIMGAGAAQVMMNIQRVLPGKKVLMIGSGNVGLIVAYQLKQAGAEVLGVIEIFPNIGGYNVHAAKIRRAGIPILPSCTIKEAKGNNCVESAIIVKVDENYKQIPGTEEEIECDLICLAAGLQSFNELCWALKMDMAYVNSLGGFVPVHNMNLETTIPNIYVAGDVAGVEEASTAMDEGRLVGVSVAEKLGYLNKEESRKLKSKILERLKDLRLGSFGEKRQKGKELLISAFKHGRMYYGQ